MTFFRNAFRRFRRLPAPTPLPRPSSFRLAVEELEGRALLSASLLTRAETIAEPGKAVAITLPLTADRLDTADAGRTFFEIAVKPSAGSSFTPGSFDIRDGAGRRLGGRYTSVGSTLVGIAWLKPGDYTASVRGRGPATGAFTLEVRLLGDADGDRNIDAADLEAIAAALQARRAGAVAALTNDPAFDFNLDGRFSRLDYVAARRNLGAAATTLTFAPVNNTGVFTAEQITFAAYGQNKSGAWFYFDASGQAHSTVGLTAVPTFTLAQIPAGLELPVAQTINGRILIGAGAAVVAPIVNSQGAVAAPNPGNPADPDNNLYNDFLEYTITSAADNGGQPNLNIDTSQVDAFGFPIILQTTPADPNSPTGVGVTPTRAAVISAFNTFVQGTPFAACVTTPASGAYGPYRILSPQDVLQLNPNIAGLNTWFDASLDAFFQKYQTETLSLATGGVTYSGQTQQIQTEGNTYTVIQFTGGGQTFNVYYPFFTTNTPAGYTPHFTPAPPPSWIVQAGKQNVAPSEMVFANNGVFADNAQQYPTNGSASQILGNLENQIVSALSRGVALLPASQWTTLSAFYPAGGTWNQYAAFWHQPAISIGGKAYGFPYDDQGGNSSDLSVNNPTRVTVTLGAWS